MTQFDFWRNGVPQSIEIQGNVKLPHQFVKFVSTDDSLFLLDNQKSLWKGDVKTGSILLSKTNIVAADLARTSAGLYIVSEFGKVYRIDDSLGHQEEVILHEDASNCIHGYATSSHRIHVKQIASNSMGLLFVSEHGELWASGSFPHLGVDTNQPKKVSFFDGRFVVAVGCGEDYCVLVTHKKDEVCPMSNGENGETEVFLSACQQCTNESALTPLTPQSYSDACPLGLQFKKSSESLSASTSTSKNNDLNKKVKSNDNSSSCSEGDSPRLSDTSECSLTNMLPEDKIEYEKEARTGGSMLLINTEAARQFLTRQLSWVSTGGEELLAEVSGPTRIIRRNVSTVASMVYEGVKTVGDKVATLSRHVSGGSDNNSESFEEFEELNNSNASITSSYRWDWSCSDNSEEAVVDRSKTCLSLGSRLIRSEVWSWGGSRLGQLGVGDTVKRPKPVLVGNVSYIGVTQVWCGRNHCLVRTLDGRVFGWGSNDSCQITRDPQIEVVSSPVAIAKALSAGAGSHHSVILTKTHNNSLQWLASEKNKPATPVNTGEDEEESLESTVAPFSVVCSGAFTCLMKVKPLARKSSLDDTISNLCSRYNDVLLITAVIVSALLEGKPSYEVLTHHQDNLIYVYETYMNTVCDVIAINGFAQIIKTVDMPAKVIDRFADRLPSRKTSPESIIICAFSQPLSHVAVYKGMLSRGGENSRMEKLLDTLEIKRKEAELTKSFWESVGGRIPESLKSPQRRIVKESRCCPLMLHNASRFSSHWFILMSDIFIHITNSPHQTHNLKTLWVDANHDSENVPNSLVVVTPEETMILVTSSANEKTEWLHAFQHAIKTHLNKSSASAPRTASYVFTKAPYKDAKYTGRWQLGKMQGSGKLEWPDGRVYTGQFYNNQCFGLGRLEIPNTSVCEGQWRDGLQNGHGVTKYENGDVYCGYYKEGFENGHGMRKNGRFTSGQASVYVGEWLLGQRHGYGVLNNLSTGEKYLGLWSGNLRNGPGLSVTLDGIYYEGTFSQDVLTGRGVMVLDDGTHYDGELREAGVFSGKGTLTFSNGDTFEGTLYGTWADGIKVNGTLQKSMSTFSPRDSFSKPGTFGQLSVGADQKWKSIFRQCYVTMGISGENKVNETQKAWENIAAILGTRHGTRHHELLQTIPTYGRGDLDLRSYKQVVAYLQQAFDSVHHPLGRSFSELVEAYTTTYGGVLVHPLLLPQAVAELRSLTTRLYNIVRVLFPALPPATSDMVVSGCDTEEVITMCGILHPIILPKLYSSLLILYSLHNQTQNDTYWKRLLKWNRHPDSTLLAFLGVDKKFWQSDDDTTPNGEGLFSEAVTTLQQLKTTFSPNEKLLVIYSTFKAITQAVQVKLGDSFIWQMDDLFPVFHYVVVRSHIQELGSEINFIDDFIEERFKNGEMDIMFTTLKACFFQILQEKINVIY
ncbi:Vacuolar sorting protein 9 (VPS9) domain [Nesidiocoris tenuis]|uniref:Vacuolar sorting protein 9 (VPS9) domain n=1 Tax=Nesidiocoris tenuis TaxID=355587 RepID=A0ABN7A924_9HEMI|nr:Vacuolar sorting protein 9 (VPS9) domain [Nesidiocoris tenuis]